MGNQQVIAAGSILPGVSHSVPLLTKLFVWSIVLEPLLYFIAADRTMTGVSANIGRLLQLTVLVVIFLRMCLMNEKIQIPNPFKSDYVGYLLFLVFSIFSAIYGYLIGAYDFVVVLSATIGKPTSAFSSFLNSSQIRPLFEYFIYFYYFAYFVILSRFLLNSQAALDYFFRVFKFMLFLSIGLGTADFLANFFNAQFLSRHMYESVYVGFRFHGLAGEPRDAFVHLGLGIAILSLNEHWSGKKVLTPVLLAVLVLCMALTQSASGVLGLLISIGLIATYSVFSLSSRPVVTMLLLICMAAGLLYLWSQLSERLIIYYSAFEVLYSTLENRGEIPPALLGQMQNVFPVWQRWLEIADGNILNIFLGTGFGSASVVNNNFSGLGNEMMNPHSQIVRTLFESGLFGFLLFILAFLFPLRAIPEIGLSKGKMVLLTLFLLGLFFGHRSAASYILLGVYLATRSVSDSHRNLGQTLV